MRSFFLTSRCRLAVAGALVVAFLATPAALAQVAPPDLPGPDTPPPTIAPEPPPSPPPAPEPAPSTPPPSQGGSTPPPAPSGPSPAEQAAAQAAAREAALAAARARQEAERLQRELELRERRSEALQRAAERRDEEREEASSSIGTAPSASERLTVDGSAVVSAGEVPTRTYLALLAALLLGAASLLFGRRLALRLSSDADGPVRQEGGMLPADYALLGAGAAAIVLAGALWFVVI